MRFRTDEKAPSCSRMTLTCMHMARNEDPALTAVQITSERRGRSCSERHHERSCRIFGIAWISWRFSPWCGDVEPWKRLPRGVDGGRLKAGHCNGLPVIRQSSFIARNAFPMRIPDLGTHICRIPHPKPLTPHRPNGHLVQLCPRPFNVSPQRPPDPGPRPSIRGSA